MNPIENKAAKTLNSNQNSQYVKTEYEPNNACMIKVEQNLSQNVETTSNPRSEVYASQGLIFKPIAKYASRPNSVILGETQSQKLNCNSSPKELQKLDLQAKIELNSKGSNQDQNETQVNYSFGLVKKDYDYSQKPKSTSLIVHQISSNKLNSKSIIEYDSSSIMSNRRDENKEIEYKSDDYSFNLHNDSDNNRSSFSSNFKKILRRSESNEINQYLSDPESHVRFYKIESPRSSRKRSRDDSFFKERSLGSFLEVNDEKEMSKESNNQIRHHYM